IAVVLRTQPAPVHESQTGRRNRPLPTEFRVAVVRSGEHYQPGERLLRGVRDISGRIAQLLHLMVSESSFNLLPRRDPVCGAHDLDPAEIRSGRYAVDHVEGVVAILLDP